MISGSDAFICSVYIDCFLEFKWKKVDTIQLDVKHLKTTEGHKMGNLMASAGKFIGQVIK